MIKLREVCRPLPDHPGLCEYIDGYSDTRVAEEVIPDFPGVNNGNVIGGYRLKLFGKLIERAPATIIDAPQDVQELRAEVARLREQVERHDNEIAIVMLWARNVQPHLIALGVDPEASLPGVK